MRMEAYKAGHRLRNQDRLSEQQDIRLRNQNVVSESNTLGQELQPWLRKQNAGSAFKCMFRMYAHIYTHTHT